MNCGLTFESVYTNLSLHLMIFPFVSTWPRPSGPPPPPACIALVSTCRRKQKTNRESLCVRRLLWGLKGRPACASGRLKAAVASVMACVSVATMGGLCAAGTMRAGRCARIKLCIARPFSCSRPPQPSHPSSTPAAVAAASIVLLCRVGEGGGVTHGWSTKQTKTSTMATPTERGRGCLAWRDKRWGWTDGRTKGAVCLPRRRRRLLRCIGIRRSGGNVSQPAGP